MKFIKKVNNFSFGCESATVIGIGKNNQLNVEDVSDLKTYPKVKVTSREMVKAAVMIAAGTGTAILLRKIKKLQKY